MSTEVQKNQKGRFSWVIPVLEVIVIIAYLVIGFGGLFDALQRMDFVGMFESVKNAIIFLIVAIVIITALCFVPIFRSKLNLFFAIWNIFWIALSVYGIMD